MIVNTRTSDETRGVGSAALCLPVAASAEALRAGRAANRRPIDFSCRAIKIRPSSLLHDEGRAQYPPVANIPSSARTR